MTADQHEFDPDTGAAYGTYKSYIVGFLLSITLTLIAFYVVGYHVFSMMHTFVVIAALALLQLYVQLVFFLHLSTHSKARWNLVSAVFTLLVVFILAAGTLWIMYNLYTNMGMSFMSSV